METKKINHKTLIDIHAIINLIANIQNQGIAQGTVSMFGDDQFISVGLYEGTGKEKVFYELAYFDNSVTYGYGMTKMIEVLRTVLQEGSSAIPGRAEKLANEEAKERAKYLELQKKFGNNEINLNADTHEIK